jgi:hypothetical protein
MVLKLRDPVSECRRRAEECGRHAQTGIDASSIQRFLNMEQRWLFLARSHQVAERPTRFVDAATHSGERK